VKIPPPTPEAIATFERWCPDDPKVSVRKMFGQPAAFLNGHLFFGVFGPQVFLRLPESTVTEGPAAARLRSFEPFPGRPMREYFVLPPKVVSDAKRVRALRGASMAFVAGLPPKAARGRR